MQRLTLLGATGSIGASTLDLVARYPQRYAVHALTAHSNVGQLVALCARFRPRVAVIADEALRETLVDALRAEGLTEIAALAGRAALVEVAEDAAVDTVVAAIVGAAGLRASMAAAVAGKRILLANKEALVMAGALFMEAVRAGGATLLPVDSEHNALYQCLPPDYASRGAAGCGVSSLVLTASGGPFLERDPATLASVTPDEACAHPNWSMGRKISVDSATMMNKGLEVIEACWLFNVEPAAVEVVIHPQSIVHSLVRYRDGSVLAQLGNPDMRTPLAHALAFPDRVDAGVMPLDLVSLGPLDFRRPEAGRFPCLELAFEAMKAGGDTPARLNAANEVAVAAFLEGRLSYTDIVAVIERTLGAESAGAAASLEDLLAVDETARRRAAEAVAGLGGS